MGEAEDRVSFATVAGLVSMLRDGTTTPTRLTEHFLARLDSVGRGFNAVVTLTPERARAEAALAEAQVAAGIDRGPLQGIPYGAKGLLATKDSPTSWGAVPFRDQVFSTDAAVLEHLEAAGAVLIGKLAMVELAGGFGYEQPDVALTGPSRNAWDPTACAGGSSSGSGAAVAAGADPFAIGSETWGAITTPACVYGVVDFRPSYGRVSRRGAMALAWTMDKLGPLARAVDDCAGVLSAIARPDPADPSTLGRPAFSAKAASSAGPFRFGVLQNATAQAEPEVAANFAASVDVLGEIGTIEEVNLPDLPFAAVAAVIVRAEAAAAFEGFIESGASHALTASEDRVGLHDGLVLPAVDYLRALCIRRLGGRALDALLSGLDAIVAPTAARVAPPRPEASPRTSTATASRRSAEPATRTGCRR